jgi:PHD/YefM family antitoxin component YafN of YafNO toxin-antitoxin module
MFKTATVSELRSDLASHIRQLAEGPLVILSKSRPAAVLIEPDVFDALLEKAEFLEDILDGSRTLSEYNSDPSVALDAEDVFSQLGR